MSAGHNTSFGSIPLSEQPAKPQTPRRYEMPRIGTANTTADGRRSFPKPHDFRAWERQDEPLSERRSPRFFLAQRQPKENPYPPLYRGVATQKVAPAAPVTPRRALNEETVAVVSAATNGAVCRMETSFNMSGVGGHNGTAQSRQQSQESSSNANAKNSNNSGNNNAAAASTSARTARYFEDVRGGNGDGDSPASTTHSITPPPSSLHHLLPNSAKQQQQQQPPSRGSQNEDGEDSDHEFFNNAKRGAPPQQARPSAAAPAANQQQKQAANKQKEKKPRHPMDSASDEDFMDDDEFLREARRKQREHAALQRQLQRMNDQNCASDEFGAAACSSDYVEDDEAGALGGGGDLLQQASASALSRRCYELLKRLFILQNSEHSVTRCFLDRLPSSEVLARIEAILKRVGASRHMSFEDFHQALNLALCPTCKQVPSIILANDDVRSVPTRREDALMRQQEEKRRFMEQERRRLGEVAQQQQPQSPTKKNFVTTSSSSALQRGAAPASSTAAAVAPSSPAKRSGSVVVGGDGSLNSSLANVYSNNASGDHISATESRVLFSLFETNGIVGLPQIAEGFDLLLRGQDYALLAYTRKICVDHPDTAEKESLVTALEIEWMLNAVVRYHSDDAELRAAARALVERLWREAHQGCVTRRTFRVAVSSDPLLFRAVQILPRFGSTDDFALRPETERRPLQPDPVDMIELMVSGGAGKDQQQQQQRGVTSFGPGHQQHQQHHMMNALANTVGSMSLEASILPSAAGFLPPIPGLGAFVTSAPTSPASSLGQKRPAGMRPTFLSGGQQQPLQRTSSNPNFDASMSMSNVKAGAMLPGRKRSVIGRGLAFESVDIHDPAFKADLNKSTDKRKQESATEAGNPQFITRHNVLHVVVGGIEYPIFDVK